MRFLNISGPGVNRRSRQQVCTADRTADSRYELSNLAYELNCGGIALC
jgi:hypothetical protein